MARLGLRILVASFALCACLAWAIGCSTPAESGSDGGAGDDGAGDTATESACLTCTTDAGSDASLGRQVALRFDSCGGVESGCHRSNAAGLNFPVGNEFVNVIRVPSTERPAFYRVNPGDPLTSYLYLKVLGDGGIDGSQMPLGGPYPASLPILIYDWIEAGAPDP